MTSVSTLGSHPDHAPIRSQPQHRRRGRGRGHAINAATPLLPPGMPSPPSFRKSNPADSPIVVHGLDVRHAAAVGRSTTTPRRWSRSESPRSTAWRRCSVSGAQKYAVHVQVDPNKLAARQIGINEVAQAVQDWNVNLPTGTLFGPHQAYNIQSTGQLMNAAGYRPLTVAWRNGTPVRLEEVANVMDSVEDERPFPGSTHPKAASAPSVCSYAPAGQQHHRGDRRNQEADPGLQQRSFRRRSQLYMRGDRSKTIREAFHDIQFTMVLTVCMVIGVIFMFLRNASATLIPSIALPISIVGTFSVMYMLDYSLDNLSMMALILSVGFVVDDAIVMLENIVRHLERGETRDAGGAERIARGRLHHRLHDALAGRRLHSRAVHGRNSGPAVPRVRRHHLRRHSDLGTGVRSP